MTHSYAPASAPRAWMGTLAAALAAALITWAAGERNMVDETGTSARGGTTPIPSVVHSTTNGMICYGILGATLGLGLGLAGGLVDRSIRSALLAGLIGLILGGATGAGAARGLVPVYFRYYEATDLTVPLLVHGGIWSAIAAATGLAFGYGVRGIGGLIEPAAYAVGGVLLATVVYEFAGIWLFPMAQVDRPIPMSPPSRLFAYLVLSLFVAASLATSVVRGSTRAKGVSVPLLQ